MGSSLSENGTLTIVAVEVRVGLPGQTSLVDSLSILNSLFDRYLFVVSKTLMDSSLRKFGSYIHIVRSINFRRFGLCKHEGGSEVRLLALLV